MYKLCQNEQICIYNWEKIFVILQHQHSHQWPIDDHLHVCKKMIDSTMLINCPPKESKEKKNTKMKISFGRSGPDIDTAKS